LAKGHLQARAWRVQIETSLAETYQMLASAVDQVTAMRTSILPGAELAFDMAREGYTQGKFAYLDVLDAQRTWFEAKVQYVEVLSSYHQALAELNRLASGYPEGTARIEEPQVSGRKP
jgi:cobalt-zinc-cadmium efflux system outer membrane protein